MRICAIVITWYYCSLVRYCYGNHTVLGGMRESGGGERSGGSALTERGRRFEFVLFNGTLVSVRTFSAMYDHTFLNSQITRSDIRPHIKWAVSLVIAYGHFSLPQGFVSVYMG